MLDERFEIRRQARQEMLLELAMVAEAVGPLNHESLREMAKANDDAVQVASDCLAMIQGAMPEEDDDAYEAHNPKHPAYHSTHADLWDMREGK